MTQKRALRGIVRAASFLVTLFVGISAWGVAQTKTVGYYASWKSGILPYDRVKYSNLTHILVAFIYPLSDGSIVSLGGGIPFSQLVSTAHSAGKKVLIAVGGASNSNGFAAATSTLTVRAVLINNLVSFIQTNNYDGVDIDWETPANSVETSQLTAFIQEMRAKFNQINASLLITMAVPPTAWGGQHFDYTNLVNYVDWFNVMCYDFYGSWSGYAGHASPLYQSPNDPTQAGSDSLSISYMISRGVPNSKLLLGIPFYSVQFSAPGLYQKTTVSVTSNPVYADIVSYLSSGWIYRWDNISKVPYLLSSDSTQFISFEDTNSVKLKVAFAVRQGLGGLMCWELAQDVMGNGSQPLLETIGTTLKSLTGVEERRAVPSGFVLYKNFPNPFNPGTHIRYSLDAPGITSLRVYNLLGQLVQTVVDHLHQDGGTYTVAINLSGLTTGVYASVLDQGDRRAVQTMIFLQ